jgi:hypothetical protein
MKILLKNFNSRVVFSEDIKDSEINGVHGCMSGAKYIVDLENNTLTYIGGVSPMFTHEDFPVWDGLTVKREVLEELKNITGFLLVYSDNCNPNYKETFLDYDFSSPNIDGLVLFIKHLRRIEPNKWECYSKEVINIIINLAINSYIHKI